MRLLGYAVEGELIVDISSPILEEVLRVLRDKFGWSPERLSEVNHLLVEMAVQVVPAQTIEVITEDPDDNRVLECAATAGSEFIVSGDKDLLRLGRYGRARIVKVAEMVAVLEDGKDQ